MTGHKPLRSFWLGNHAEYEKLVMPQFENGRHSRESGNPVPPSQKLDVRLREHGGIDGKSSGLLQIETLPKNCSATKSAISGVVLSACVLAAFNAHAEVYRCQRDGHTVFTDQPCSKTARPMDLPHISIYGDKSKSSVTKAEKKMASDWDKRVADDKKKRDKADQAWVKQHEAKQTKEDAVRSGLNARKVVKGMSMAHVRELLGEPDAVRTQQGKDVEIIVWSYKSAAGAKQTISFRDGEVNGVTRFSNAKKK